MFRFLSNIAFAFLLLCYAAQAISILSASNAKEPEEHSEEFTCEKDGLFLNPENCNQFIECSGGQPYHMACPAGLHYSTSTERCEAPCDAYCDQTLACECEWSSCGSTVPAETIGPPVPSSFICEKDGLYRYPESCTNYISCESGSALAQSCPDGLHFNDIVRHCVIPCDSFCDVSLACECKWPTCVKNYSAVVASTQELNCTEDGVYPDPNDCTYRYYCSNGKSFHLQCDGIRRFHYDPVHKSCVSPCEAKCDPSYACKCLWPSCKKTLSASEQEENVVTETPEFSNPSQEELDALCSENGFVAHPHNCSRYIVCVGGRAYGAPCPKGLHFSSTTEDCEEPCLASCDESLACQCGWESCKLENAPLCEYDCIQDGVFKNPESCFSYVHCSNGIAHVMRCPANLHFNEETKGCDYPCNAKCDKTLGCQCGWPSCSSGVCRLPLQEGNCSSYFPRWYYDGATSQCQRYVYRGCNGNENSFLSREECEKKCSSHVCDLPMEEGSCTGYYPRYYFNKDTSTCEQFVYGGCEGNENQFKTKKECEQKCGEADVHGMSMSEIDVCSLKKDSGRCSEQNYTKSRYYFEQEEGRCLKFAYSGCGGNGNNFETKQKCEQNCVNNNSLKRSSVPDGSKTRADFKTPYYCLLPPEFGTCKMRVWYRIYYEPVTKRCWNFFYGGCGGNANNFHTGKECRQVCQGETDEISRSLKDTDLQEGKKNELSEEYQCREDRILPDLEKCGSYIQCVGGRRYPKECPEGLHFSEYRKRCVPPCEAKCVASIGGDVFTCAKDGLHPDPQNCCAYIECTGGRAVRKFCNRGLHFSREIGECGSPCGARCDASLACKCGWDSCSNLPERIDLFGLYPDCVSWKGKGHCDGIFKRYHYNTTTEQCDPFEYSGCGGNENNYLSKSHCQRMCQQEEMITFQCPQPNGNFTLNPYRCRHYYQCSNNVVTLQKCPLGQGFHWGRKECVPESFVWYC